MRGIGDNTNTGQSAWDEAVSMLHLTLENYAYPSITDSGVLVGRIWLNSVAFGQRGLNKFVMSFGTCSW